MLSKVPVVVGIVVEVVNLVIFCTFLGISFRVSFFPCSLTKLKKIFARDDLCEGSSNLGLVIVPVSVVIVGGDVVVVVVGDFIVEVIISTGVTVVFTLSASVFGL